MAKEEQELAIARRYYTDDGLLKIEEGYANLSQRCMAIQERCMEYKFSNQKAKEFALHGFAVIAHPLGF